MACSSEIVVNDETAVIDTGVDVDTWITIPAGVFYTGMIHHEDQIDYDYQMMLTHVTNAQYAKYLAEAYAKKFIKIREDSVMGDYKGDPFDGYLHEEEIQQVKNYRCHYLSPELIFILLMGNSL